MNTVVPISQDDERLEEAVRWALKIDEGLSVKEQAALEAWLAKHPRNSTELIEVARAWDKLDSLSRLAALFPIEYVVAARSRGSFKRTYWSTFRWAAGVANVILLVGVTWLLLPPWEPGQETKPARIAQPPTAYETVTGQQRIVELEDGTVVSMNTRSQVTVTYSESARMLQLMHGEIHVEVAPDPTRPLSVFAADRIVQAVGTAFAVEITADQRLKLVVTEGQVLVGVQPARLEDAGSPILTPLSLPSSPLKTVSAGEELIVGPDDEVVAPVSTEEIEMKLAWRDGRLIFRSEPLAKALAEVERYTTIEFVFLDDTLKARAISGRYKTGDVDSLLLALRANFSIAAEYDGENRVLLTSL